MSPSLNRVMQELTQRIPERAVVLLSGGQDSTTVLHYAMTRHGAGNLLCVGFDYGQRHGIELEHAEQVASAYDIPFLIVPIRGLAAVGESALTSSGDVNEPHTSLPDVPNSFVPSRNAVFLALAHAFAVTHNAKHIYGGMCQTDYSGYPDCRRPFIDQLEQALNAGYNADVRIHTPLMFLTKTETWELASSMGEDALQDVYDSHTCYEGVREWNEWGHGCGNCPACVLRRNGYDKWMAGDV